MATTLCPCSSGRPYKECCAPYHKGAEPPDPPSLVRARYSAFAMGEIEFLYRTLDVDHPDRVKHTREHVLAALRAASSSFKYMGLELRESRDADEHHRGERSSIPESEFATRGSEFARDRVARVSYRAKIFRKGTDVSFVEHAEFRHDGVGWRYLAGTTTDA